MTDNDFVEHFDNLPEELSSSEDESSESLPKSNASRDKHRYAKRRRLEELLEEKRLSKELSDFCEENSTRTPYYYDEDSATDSYYSDPL